MILSWDCLFDKFLSCDILDSCKQIIQPIFSGIILPPQLGGWFERCLKDIKVKFKPLAKAGGFIFYALTCARGDNMWKCPGCPSDVTNQITYPCGRGSSGCGRFFCSVACACSHNCDEVIAEVLDASFERRSHKWMCGPLQNYSVPIYRPINWYTISIHRVISWWHV